MRTLPDLRESAQLWVQPTLLAYRRVAAPTHGRKWHTPTALIWFFFVSYRSEAVIGERRARARLGPSLTLNRRPILQSNSIALFFAEGCVEQVGCADWCLRLRAGDPR